MSEQDAVMQLARVLGLDAGEAHAPPDRPPSTFTRRAQIQDAAVLGLIAEMHAHMGEVAKLTRRIALLKRKMEVAKGEAIERLNSIYPAVEGEPGEVCGVGMRQHEGAWWYVGWTHEEHSIPTATAAPAPPTTGQYL